MDFRILCVLSVTIAVASSYTSDLCTVEHDLSKCRYNMLCTNVISTNSGWENYQRNSYPPHLGIVDNEDCSIYITYAGYRIDPIFMVIKNPSSDMSGSIPASSNYRRRDEGMLHIIYSLDLSENDYENTPSIKSMQNLAILNISRNHLKTAVLSNQNELNMLKELDLSYNTISDINVNSYEHPYSNLKKINMSHNYLVKIPDAVFDKIDDLQTLDLSHNYIEGLSQFTFEGTKTLLHLNLSNNRLTDINSSLFRFSELKTLSLSNNRIKNLNVHDFDKLQKLEFLDLSSNSIKTIDNVFQNMAFLYSLDLSNNLLEVASKDTFANLISLTSIDLSKNKLRSLPKDLFKNKTIHKFSVSDNFLEGSLTKGTFEGINVTTLSLGFQLLTAVENYAFNGLTSLDALYLNNNGIYTLSNMCFKTLTGLLTLDLSNNKISSIDFDKTDLGNLQSLFLRNNRLAQIKQEHFHDLNSLEYLDLSGNSISQLEPNSFKSLKSLINLEISDNPLSGTLKTDTFDGLVSLPTLDISRNLLTTVQNASFNDMNELKDLNMSRSKIKELQFNVFVHTGYIETLDLSYNELENFLVNVTELVGLSTLLLNNNLLKTISSASLYGLSRMTNLNLAHNFMENIENDSFITLADLRILDLSYNEKFKFTQDLLKKIDHLHSLNLSGIKTDIRFEKEDSTISNIAISDTGLHNISALNLSALTHITSLVLRNNNVSQLKIGDFSGITQLYHLDLSFNKISFIQPGVFKDNGLLFSLNISHNYLSAVGYGIFRGLIYLNTLDMSFNNIKDLQSERFYEVTSLSQLIVDHNNINEINAEEFAGTSLSKLSIGDNPLPCRILVKLKKQGVSFEITAIKKDGHNDENVDGVTCNKDQERSSFEPNATFNNISDKNEILTDMRNILYNMSMSNKTTVEVSKDKYLENITNIIEKSNVINEENLSNLANLTARVIDLNNATNILLQKILNSLHDDLIATTPSVPLFTVNNTADLIPYINKVRKELEKTIADEKENVIHEIENKFSLLHYQTESLPTSPSNEKLVSNNEGTKSIFTETCVALILLILVCLVLYKFYKSRMFVRSRLSYSTRELPGAMDNSTL
ncbi:hypothetical protein PYW07_006032 [Mythimna separata]|uniref:Uncharacterized protein n=1 Tax=Mythimna separata TaxID=271217 RepID=A0AAD7YJ72_MYTSE|nr:hypothetical protein PYW07_006032 [Mythimna separata]